MLQKQLKHTRCSYLRTKAQFLTDFHSTDAWIRKRDFSKLFKSVTFQKLFRKHAIVMKLNNIDKLVSE